MGELNKTTSNGAIVVAIDRIANILEFVLTKDTPKWLAVKGIIEDVQNSNLSPIEKAVITWNAKKIIREHRNQADIARLAIEELSDGTRADEVDDSC
jgi:hypothetical protein